MGKVLIIDDNEFYAEALSEMIGSFGHNVVCAGTAEDGLKSARSSSFDVVFLDIHLPDGNGLVLLPKIHATPSAPEVIIITGFGNPDAAELAIKNGAWDFIEKPLEKKLIELPLIRALQYREAKKNKGTPSVLKRESIIGSSSIMEKCLELIAQAAANDVNVLITGETGTGKEVFAQTIHNNSSRSAMPFVTVDCASLPPALIESLLFGHEKGAFTGADRIQEGLIKQADGGTLFLDEVGDLPLAAQKAFLRVLQEHRFRPLGAKKEVKSSFRVIAATNRNLDKMLQEGRFREDLLFRLRTVAIELPPLKERSGDIKELTAYYVNKICSRQNTEVKGFSPEFIETLCAYDWPGNVRELVSALESALAAAHNETILYPKHLPVHIRVRLIRDTVSKKDDSVKPSVKIMTLKELRDSVFAREEKQYLQELMVLTSGNIKEACKISGLGRARLYQLLKKYNITMSV
ncbi:MAG: sigma-54 dependent transcriptional regulator [Smithellaceae bacterium]